MMWKINVKRSLIVLLAGLVVPVLAQKPAPTVAPSLLRMKFRSGEVSKYQTSMQMTMTIPLPGQNTSLKQAMEMNVVQQARVTKALPEGGGETETTVLESQGMMNGQPFAPPTKAAPIVTTFDARGNILSVKGDNPEGESASLLKNLFSSGGLKTTEAYLPSGPVRPGDTWSQPLKALGFSGGQAGSAQSRFLKVEKVGHYQTAKIRTLVTLPIKLMLNDKQEPIKDPAKALMFLTGTLKITMDSNFAITEGKTVRSAGNGNANLALKSRETAPRRSPRNTTPTKPIMITMQMRIGNNLIE